VRYQVEFDSTNAARQRLVSMAADALPGQRDGVAASILLGKIEQAMVVSPESLPPSAVGMKCEVEVRDNIKKAVKHLRIGFHGEEDRGRHGVSVLTPIGAALVERRLNRLVHACKG
jgi:transcription elongation GreA/GreB family factor